MAQRMRVHELAKEFNVNNKDLIDRILRLGIQVKNHMSTLSDSAVQKIRQHFTEASAEAVEQKRIGREVIRRRKKTTAEETPTESEALSQETVEAEHPAAIAELSPKPEAPGPPISIPEEPIAPQPFVEAVAAKPIEEPPVHEPEERPVEAPSTIAAAPPSSGEPELEAEPVKAAEREPVSEPSVADADKSRPTESKVEETVQETEPTAGMGPMETTEPVAVEDESHLKQERGKEVEEEAADVGAAEEMEVAEAPVETVAKEAPRAEEPPPPAAPTGRQEAAAAEAPEAEAAEEAENQGEEDKPKSKKAKKRRRKKTHKDEPARIIKLPEIITEEPEEEPELHIVPPRLHVVVEDAESKDAQRKKRKPEEAERDAQGRKRKPAGKKEVFEREDLYSKKELAAQADRGRGKDRGRPFKEPPKPEPVVPKIGKRKIKVEDAIIVGNLAKQMGVKAGEVIKKLLLLGLPANVNQAVDFDTAALVASEFDFEVEKVGFEEEGIMQAQEDRPQDLITRPPVVTVMGHVDHGKTSLLDAIRHTNVIGGEAGGITQHIGAYYVKLERGDVVFLDTPGHEAFTSMRARGAKVTDIVILVVAADDGVMQQTIEAINHAKAADVPIIVAINKIDKPNANIDRVKRELADHGLMTEEWGGSTTMVELSAKKNIGIDDLLEMVILQSEIMELKANPNKAARGRVIEAKLDKGRGPVASILVQEGTLRTGDCYVCGTHFGRVRNMFNDRGQKLEEAGPATPLEVIGLSGVPNAGDDFVVVADEKQAKTVAEHRLLKQRERELTRTGKITLEKLYEQIQEGAVKDLNVILKTDVQGSMEAITDSLVKLSTSEVKVNLIHTGTGAITETDIMLASASNAIVIGFNVRADAKVQDLIEQENVDVRYYDVIYQILSDIQDAMVGMLEPEYKENNIGRAKVIQLFHVPKIGVVIGCQVTDGRLERGARARVLRESVVIWDGKIASLRRFKDDAKEVKAGFECGVVIENFSDLKIDDVIEAYELQEIKPTLDRKDSPGEDKKNKERSGQ
ncbi:MAG: translation initiation factor IF-2 [Syntrophobacteraceae bacterium]